MKNIDLNSDVGESFGNYTLGNDRELMKHISSANIACGFHAGDPLVIQKTVGWAIENKTAIGAHPGYPDLQGFGRREMDLSEEEIEAMVVYQVSVVAGFARSFGVEMVHVKPHGAMYNHAAKDIQSARAIARGVARYSKSLILVGLAGSRLIEAGVEYGLRVANEGFPDRQYQSDGSLMPRKQPGAVLTDCEEVAQHTVNLATRGITYEVDGTIKAIPVDTLCIHGDNPSAIQIAQAIRCQLNDVGIEIKRFDG